MNILLIETSETICSVAIAENDKVVESYVCEEAMKHASQLPVFVEQALAYLKENGMGLDAVAISGGPGSYTGLRIAASTAKGICYARGIKLIALDTLKLIAYTALKKSIIPMEPQAVICPMVDARRMEVYTEMFDTQMNTIGKPEAKIIDENSYADIDKPIYFCGNGAKKCCEVIKNPNAVYIENIYPTAEMMAEQAAEAYRNEKFEDVAYYEPFYLKEFYTTAKKINEK